MTLWTFDLRSGDSDTEDEESLTPPRHITPSDTHPQQDDTQTARQKQTNNEVEELFGTVKDDESVEYKPNPWSIAKINANARNVARLQQPKPKPTWKPTRIAGSKPSGLQQFWNDRKGSTRDGNCVSGTRGKQSVNNGNKSLRDSISEALRRGGPGTAVSPKQNYQIRERDVVLEKQTDQLDSESPDTTPLLVSRASLNDSIQPMHPESAPQIYDPLEPSAYIAENFSALSVPNKSLRTSEDHELQGIPTRFPPGDTCLLDDNIASALDYTAPNTPDNTSYFPSYQRHDEAGFRNRFIQSSFSPSPGSGWENTTLATQTPTHFRAVSPQFGQDWMSQGGVRLGSSYSGSLSEDTLGPSPTVQLIARFAAPKLNEPVEWSGLSVCPEADFDLDKPILLARTPLSPPVVEEPQYTLPAHNLRYPPYTPERSSRLTPKQRLTTPPRKMNVTRFDPDDKPFWSTLPTPPTSKPKPQANEVKTSRFRLPGSFLGSSPLSGNSGRTLYKPPARKRTQSRGDEPTRKWKVTRIE